jgi:DNA primase catalytic subunit
MSILESNQNEIPWRLSTEEEIIQFYEMRFKKLFEKNASSYVQNIANVSEWACVDINGNFIRGTIGDEIHFDTFKELQAFLIENRAISAYHGQDNIFTVDIDSKDVAKKGFCDRHTVFGDNSLKEGTEEYNKRLNYINNIPPRNYPYCFHCVETALYHINCARDILLSMGVSPDLTSIYFSGQGAHLECYDSNMTELGVQAKRFLANHFEKEGIPVDKVVTHGENRVFRIAGSLHGKVNRIKLKLEPWEKVDINTIGVL